MDFYKVKFSRKAKDHLFSIYHHIAYILQSPSNAKEQCERIKDAVFSLETFPERRRVIKQDQNRIMTVDNYCILYKIAGKDIFIIDIVYGRSNYLSKL